MFSMSQSAVNAHILMGFFYAYTDHFRKVTKMIIHIKDIVEVATCLQNLRLSFPHYFNATA